MPQRRNAACLEDIAVVGAGGPGTAVRCPPQRVGRLLWYGCFRRTLFTLTLFCNEGCRAARLSERCTAAAARLQSREWVSGAGRLAVRRGLREQAEHHWTRC